MELRKSALISFRGIVHYNGAMRFLLHYAIPATVSLTFGLVFGLWLGDSTPDSAAPLVTNRSVSQSSPVIPSVPVTEAQHKFSEIRGFDTIFEKLHFTYQLASNSNLAELTEMLEQVVGDPDPLLSHNVAGILLEKMLVIDPLHALAFIDSHREMEKRYFTAHILTSWVRHDPDSAIDYFKGINNQQLQYAIGARLLDDPTLEHTGLISEIELALGPQSEQLLEQARLKRMAPASAFEEAILRTDHRRQGAMMRAIGRWFQQDPDGALQRITGLANTAERDQLLQMVISIQAQQDPRAALNTIRNFAPDNLNLRRQALSIFAQRDPVGSLASVEAWVAETGNYDLVGRLVAKWILLDETSALAYLSTVPQGSRTQVYQNLAHAYISVSPVNGMNWLMSLGPEFDQTVKRSALNSLGNHPDVAEGWISRLTGEPELQSILLAQVAGRKAQVNPVQAYQWLQQYRNSQAYQQASIGVLHAWAQTDPATVANMIDSRLDDPAYAQIVMNTAGAWVSKDQDAALSWIDALPSSDAKVHAVNSVIHRLADPDVLIPLIKDLPLSAQSSVKLQLAHSWAQKSPGQIDAIIQQLELNEANADALRNQTMNSSGLDPRVFNSGRIRQLSGFSPTTSNR